MVIARRARSVQQFEYNRARWGLKLLYRSSRLHVFEEINDPSTGRTQGLEGLRFRWDDCEFPASDLNRPGGFVLVRDNYW